MCSVGVAIPHCVWEILAAKSLCSSSQAGRMKWNIKCTKKGMLVVSCPTVSRLELDHTSCCNTLSPLKAPLQRFGCGAPCHLLGPHAKMCIIALMGQSFTSLPGNSVLFFSLFSFQNFLGSDAVMGQ